ncbi:hypothetical protein MTBSS4_290028 [Magnetospirillum sp. SS-4]|nr:hypothetical protein MTBSS4_290028 [Magnetospirillum sp. SS-4]
MYVSLTVLDTLSGEGHADPSQTLWPLRSANERLKRNEWFWKAEFYRHGIGTGSRSLASPSYVLMLAKQRLRCRDDRTKATSWMPRDSRN